MAISMTRTQTRLAETKEKKEDVDMEESRGGGGGGGGGGEETIELPCGLYLINQASIVVIIRRVDPSSRSIDEWTLKETLRNVISRETLLTAHQFQLTMEKVTPSSSLAASYSQPTRGGRKGSGGVEKVGVGKIGVGGGGGGMSSSKKKRERERDEKGGVAMAAGIRKPVAARVLVRVICATAAEAGAKVIDKLDGLELTLSGMRLVCDAQSEDIMLEEMREAWEVKYGHSETGYRSKRSGERPDTLVIHGLPCRWLAEPRVSSKPSILVTHSIFSSFGTIRNLEFVNDEESGQGSIHIPSAFGVAPFMMGLECGVMVQYEDHFMLCKALQALCGRALKKSGSGLCVHYRVEWDSDEYFSEKSVRRRKFEKDRREEMERRKAAEEKRRAAIEDRKAELRRLEQEKKEEEERERLKREEAERIRREEEAARIAEEKRKEEEERMRHEEEERRKEEERKQLEEAAKEEERRKQEEERLEREKKEQEARRLRKEREKKEKEEQRAKQLEEEMRERERAARKREEEERERRRILAERDLRRLDEKRQLLEEELGRRDTEKRLRARVAERMAEKTAALEREEMRRRDEKRETSSSEQDDPVAVNRDCKEVEKNNQPAWKARSLVVRTSSQPARKARSTSRSPSRPAAADSKRVQMIVGDNKSREQQQPPSRSPESESTSSSSSESTSASESTSEDSTDASDGSSSSDSDSLEGMQEENTYEMPQKRLRSIIVCSPMSDSGESI